MLLTATFFPTDPTAVVFIIFINAKAGVVQAGISDSDLFFAVLACFWAVCEF